VIGRIGRSDPEPLEADNVREQRIRSARANRYWTELDPSTLIPRGRLLVREETDEAFTAKMGAVWNPLGGIAFSDTSPVYFTVEDGHVRLLEKYPRTWSEITYAQRGAQ